MQSLINVQGGILDNDSHRAGLKMFLNRRAGWNIHIFYYKSVFSYYLDKNIAFNARSAIALSTKVYVIVKQM